MNQFHSARSGLSIQIGPVIQMLFGVRGACLGRRTSSGAGEPPNSAIPLTQANARPYWGACLFTCIQVFSRAYIREGQRYLGFDLWAWGSRRKSGRQNPGRADAHSAVSCRQSFSPRWHPTG